MSLSFTEETGSCFFIPIVTIRSFVYLLKLFPHVPRTCAVADVNKLVVFNSQRYRTLSFFVFSLSIVRDRIKCVALHYLPCVLTNQQHLYFKLPNLVV